MNTEALIVLIVAQVTVTIITVYLFVRVMKTPHAVDEDHEDLLFGP